MSDSEAKALKKHGRSITVDSSGLVGMIDNFDRPGDAFVAGAYAGTGEFEVGFEDKPGKRIPKAGGYAGAGVGYARAEYSVFNAEAKGPNVGIGSGISATSFKGGLKAELVSASATAGPVKASVGLAADTTVGISPTHVEAKVLGTGFSFGRRMGFSMFGSGIEFNLW